MESNRRTSQLKGGMNTILAECLSRYRFICGYVCSVLDDAEIIEISNALSLPDNVSQHIESALREYSKKVDANMNSVVRSAVSGLEAVCVDLVDSKKDTLTQALKYYQSHAVNGKKINDRLFESIKSFYKFTCQSGIRHGGSDCVKLEDAEARLSLVICSALVNYLNEVNEVNKDATN